MKKVRPGMVLSITLTRRVYLFGQRCLIQPERGKIIGYMATRREMDLNQLEDGI